MYPDEGPLYVCVHYYALPLDVMHGTYTLCISLVSCGETIPAARRVWPRETSISPTITTCHFVIVGNKKLASGGQFN